MEIDGVKIYQGHVLDALKNIEDKSVQCCVTSPPYFNLRDYEGNQDQIWGGDSECDHDWDDEGNCRNCTAWSGSLGNEPDLNQYVHNLVLVFREVRRVLRDDGVMWLNLGDSFAGHWGENYAHKPFGENREPDESTVPNKKSPDWNKTSYKPKDKMGVPHSVAFALRDDGWYWRSTVVWAKAISYCESYSGSCMPESVNGWRWERHKVKIEQGKIYLVRAVRSVRTDMALMDIY